ncbi:putative MFS transporter, AGZA family, xanthine/uracil permease [Trichlorobacter thiogenes]|uniref:Putative MFS transporter, AGZA family, xanthine/uracil permease n=1 Tax=Trichlorobacter thiogenes TaxID=115783 RepID=A0A1T4LJR3_9BACT|nr:NCS2 family permease [Trichlorobacter thiogenes]SJZ54871.1 putative MFS transporter, AGZA family, xanthine/uracil permease [Trichlorobacter thiogenes]
MKLFFEFDHHNTSYRQETLAGLTTFLTMAYIMVVNPSILAVAGIPKDAQVTATILAAMIGCLMMAFWAKRPFAIAPYMGENAFIAFVVVKGMGYSWQIALGAVFWAGLVFILLTLLKVRSWLAESIPISLKASFAVGIGLFLTFIGLNETGLVVLGVAGAPVRLGNIAQSSVLLAAGGFLLTVVLMARKVNGALLYGIVATTTGSVLLGLTKLPTSLVSLPPSLEPIFLKLDIAGTLQPGVFPVVLVIFMMAFLDTIGTLIGLSMRADLLDANGNLPEIERPMLADAVATTLAPLLGTTTTGAYIESAAGIAAGGRTGFTALVVAVLFGLSLFFAPLFTMVPGYAAGIALVVIGALMIQSVTRLDFDDLTELMPAFLTISLMIFTFNIGVGMTVGLFSYPLIKLCTGRAREVSGGMWVLAALSLTFFVFMPKG